MVRYYYSIPPIGDPFQTTSMLHLIASGIASPHIVHCYIRPIFNGPSSEQNLCGNCASLCISHFCCIFKCPAPDNSKTEQIRIDVNQTIGHQNSYSQIMSLRLDKSSNKPTPHWWGKVKVGMI